MFFTDGNFISFKHITDLYSTHHFNNFGSISGPEKYILMDMYLFSIKISYKSIYSFLSVRPFKHVDLRVYKGSSHQILSLNVLYMLCSYNVCKVRYIKGWDSTYYHHQ